MGMTSANGGVTPGTMPAAATEFPLDMLPRDIRKRAQHLRGMKAMHGVVVDPLPDGMKGDDWQRVWLAATNRTLGYVHWRTGAAVFTDVPPADWPYPTPYPARGIDGMTGAVRWLLRMGGVR